MSKLFKDKSIINKPQNRFGKLAKDVNEKHFKEWIEKYIDNSDSLALHNIRTYKMDPVTIMFDSVDIELPFNIFRNSPAIIQCIDSTVSDSVSVKLQSPLVLYNDTSRKTYVITGSDMDIIELLNIKHDIKSITVISDYDSFETFNRMLNYFLSKYPTAKLNINYTTKILDDSFTNIISYIIDSVYKDKVNIEFRDYGVLIDNSLTTTKDDNLVFIKGE